MKESFKEDLSTDSYGYQDDLKEDSKSLKKVKQTKDQNVETKREEKT